MCNFFICFNFSFFKFAPSKSPYFLNQVVSLSHFVSHTCKQHYKPQFRCIILNYRQPKRHWIISLCSRVILVYNLFHLLLLCCVRRQDYTKKREHNRSLLLPRVLKKYINPNVYFLLSLFKSCFLFFIYEELCIIKKTITARLQPK